MNVHRRFTGFLALLCFLGWPRQARSQAALPRLYVLDSSLCPTIPAIDCLLGHKFILVGEMHGTQEPVRFLVQCARLLAFHKNVQVGFEIPAADSARAAVVVTEESLARHPLLIDGLDGRFSDAWRDAILELLAIPQVTVFFFDARRDQTIDRDSAMYLNLRGEYLRDTQAVVLTISGNVHTRLQPYKGTKTMGYYVQSYLDDRVLALTHRYQKGTMYNAIDGNARLHDVDHGPDGMSGLSPTGNFFYDDPLCHLSTAWNGFLYTRKINAAFPVKNK